MVRDITLRYTVDADLADAEDLRADLGLDEGWPDSVVAIEVVREGHPRRPTVDERESMGWR